MGKLRPKLVIIEGHDKGKVIPLEDGTAIIGRTKGDVLVQDARVSRSHVAIHFDTRTDILTFTDLKSLNGTFLNGEPSEAGILHDGDKLLLGSTLFDCQLTDLPEGAPREKASSAPPPSPAPQFDLGESSLSHASSLSGLESMNEVYSDPLHTREEPRPSAQHFRAEAIPPSAATNSARTNTKASPSSRRKQVSLLDRYRALPKRTRMTAVVAVLIVFSVLLMSKSSPNDSEVAKVLVDVRELERQGKLEEAISAAEKAKVAYADHSEIYMALGNLYTKRGARDLAIQSYEGARDRSPEQQMLSVRLIPLYVQTGAKDKLEKELLKLDEQLKAGHHSRELFIEAARVFIDFRELKHAPEKVLILSKALQKEFAPESSIGYKLEAQVLFQQGKNQEAQASLEKGLQKSPDDEWILENLAFAKLALRDPAGAKDVLTNWIQMNPGNTKALLVMSYLKYNDKDFDGALPFAQQIIKIDENNPRDPLLPEAVNLVGLILWQQDKKDIATNWIQRACQLGYQASCQHEANQKGAAPPATPSPTPTPSTTN